MRQTKAKGIIINSQVIFEKDRRIEIFSPTLGKHNLLVKGGNSSKSKYGGRISVANYCDFVIYKGKSFDILMQCDILSPFFEIRKDFNKISLVFYFFDIIRKVTVYGQVNAILFELVLESLERLDKREDLNSVMCFFHQRFLGIEGILREDDGVVTESVFQTKFEEYSGKKIMKPLFI
jgi:DNA repair protein RecO (recombination protein O)